MINKLAELLKWTPDIEVKNGDFYEVAKWLVKNGVILLDTNVITIENRPLITHIAEMPLNDVLDLIRAKKEERLIVPPCKVGDTVYTVGVFTGQIIPSNVVGIDYTANDVFLYLENSTFVSVVHQLGKTVFLTKEEAEEKLKELNNNA